MLDFVSWVFVGAIVGWAGSLFAAREAQATRLLNVVAGVVGAFLAGAVLSPVVGIGLVRDTGFSLPALGIALAGAVGLLFAVNLFRPVTAQ
jgi:uncharacterized membrane protein YeaQ/YmgE (transglycosylase-associated protein family)